MPRSLRLELAGGVFHVTSRGDRREVIFLDDLDRKTWLSIFSKVCKKTKWICHSYCLMDNHYHLLLETPEKNLSSGMRDLNGIYAQSFNKRFGLVGHLFQGRFKSILVDKDSYLLELARYVPLNPVRAELVANAEDWHWSSYRQMIGKSPAVQWLQTDWVLGQFHQDRERARELFIDFVQSGIGLPSIWENLRGGFVLGSDEFLGDISRLISETDENSELALSLKKILAPDLLDFERKCISPRAAMVEAYSSGRFTMKEIARHFNVHPLTVSRAVREAKLLEERGSNRC